MKYSFKNDYSEIAHPRVIKALEAVGSCQFEGYGLDEHSSNAVKLIKDIIKSNSADIHFVSGGTHANLIVLSSILRPHEAVIACDSGHISIHETGAIEATGHKVLTAFEDDGKLRTDSIDRVVKSHTDEHMVKPKAVFISHATEIGTVYTKEELTRISRYCKEHDLYLYMDGARIASGVNSKYCDLTYADIATLVDVFYFGGTKNGALFGEAIVLCNEEIKKDFRFSLKQRGGLLAKGAILGIQFEELFKDGLYDSLAVYANNAALRLAEGINESGVGFMSDVQSNQIFPIFSNELIKRLESSYMFHKWKKVNDDSTIIRLVTSWATPVEAIESFIENLSRLNLRT